MKLVEVEKEEEVMEQVKGGEEEVTMQILSRWPGEVR